MTFSFCWYNPSSTRKKINEKDHNQKSKEVYVHQIEYLNFDLLQNILAEERYETLKESEDLEEETRDIRRD